MTQAALDDAYANGAHIAGAEYFPPRWRAESAAVRATVRADLDVIYADGPGAAFDLFHPAGDPPGLTVFVHGGYWRAFGKSDWSHFARGLLTRDHAVAIIGYPLAPRVRIAGITRLIARAIDHAASLVPARSTRPAIPPGAIWSPGWSCPTPRRTASTASPPAYP